MKFKKHLKRIIKKYWIFALIILIINYDDGVLKTQEILSDSIVSIIAVLIFFTLKNFLSNYFSSEKVETYFPGLSLFTVFFIVSLLERTLFFIPLGVILGLMLSLIIHENYRKNYKETKN